MMSILYTVTGCPMPARSWTALPLPDVVSVQTQCCSVLPCLTLSLLRTTTHPPNTPGQRQLMVNTETLQYITRLPLPSGKDH